MANIFRLVMVGGTQFKGGSIQFKSMCYYKWIVENQAQKNHRNSDGFRHLSRESLYPKMQYLQQLLSSPLTP